LTKEQLISWALRHNYREDRYGHLCKEQDGKIYRLKLSSIAARHEIKIQLTNGSEWVRLRSGYFKDLSILPDDKLTGMKR